jgi:hypothetical protein
MWMWVPGPQVEHLLCGYMGSFSHTGGKIQHGIPRRPVLLNHEKWDHVASFSSFFMFVMTGPVHKILRDSPGHS